MYQGLISGLRQGLLSGLGSKWASGTTLLADFDYSAPVTQSFGSANATHQYLLQDAVAGDYPDTGTGTAADLDTFVTGYQEQIAPGIYDGTSMVAQKAWETSAISSTARVSDSAVFDSNNTDLYFRAYFRVSETPSVGKRVASKRTGTAAGWDLILNSNGTINVTIEDGDTNTTLVTVTGNYADGALHYLEFFYDDSASELTVNTDLDSGNAATDVSIITGTMTTAANFTIGNVGGHEKFQWVMVEGAEGAAAATMFAETGWWTHASDPTGLLTTQTRASLISVPVAAGYVGHFSDDTLPIGYHSAFSDTNKLGLYCNSAVTNIMPYSEVSTGHSSTWNTTTDNYGDAPDGFRSSVRLLASATNQAYFESGLPVSASTEYTYSVWMKSTDGASSYTIRQFIWDEVNTTSLGQTDHTVTGSWQLFSVTGTMGVGGVTASPRVQSQGSSDDIEIWGEQLNLGDGRGAYIRTSGASAALVFSDYDATGAAGQYAKADGGEVESVIAYPWASRTTSNLLSIGGAIANYRDFLLVGYSKPRFQPYDSAGTLAGTLDSTDTDRSDTEITWTARWESDGTLAVGGGADAQTLLNGADSQVDIGTFTATDTLTKVQIGNSGLSTNSANAFDGFIQRLRIWDGERA